MLCKFAMKANCQQPGMTTPLQVPETLKCQVWSSYKTVRPEAVRDSNNKITRKDRKRVHPTVYSEFFLCVRIVIRLVLLLLLQPLKSQGHRRVAVMALHCPTTIDFSKNTRWPRIWANSGAGAAADVSPSTLSSCEWSVSLSLCPRTGVPWSCSRSSRQSGPPNSSREGWRNTNEPRASEELNNTVTAMRKQVPRT